MHGVNSECLPFWGMLVTGWRQDANCKVLFEIDILIQADYKSEFTLWRYDVHAFLHSHLFSAHTGRDERTIYKSPGNSIEVIRLCGRCSNLFNLLSRPYMFFFNVLFVNKNVIKGSYKYINISLQYFLLMENWSPEKLQKLTSDDLCIRADILAFLVSSVFVLSWIF